jgi:hypothetical protein
MGSCLADPATAAPVAGAGSAAAAAPATAAPAAAAPATAAPAAAAPATAAPAAAAPATAAPAAGALELAAMAEPVELLDDLRALAAERPAPARSAAPGRLAAVATAAWQDRLVRHGVPSTAVGAAFETARREIWLWVEGDRS